MDIQDLFNLDKPSDLNISNCGQNVGDSAVYFRCKKSLEKLAILSKLNEQYIISQKGKNFYVKLSARLSSLMHWVEYSYMTSQKEYFKAGTARDLGMAKLFEIIADLHSKRKTIILAHLGHIARNTVHEGDRFNPNYENMGSAIVSKFGGSYKILGFTAKQIGCEPTLCIEKPFIVPKEYHEFWVEKILSESLSSNAFLSLESSSLLRSDKPHLVGGHFGILKDNFDALFYLRQSEAATP